MIGDDDGLLPHALAELDALTRQTDAKAIHWAPAYYTWPNVAVAGQGDYLRLPLGCGVCERNGAEVIREVAAFREFYTALPMLYNAAVRRDVLADLRARVGRVFPHPIPDVYSGFAVAHAAGRFLSVTAPMTVSGQSGASNGIATLFDRGRNAIDREFHALNAKDGLRSEPTVPDLPVFPHVPVADAFAFAKRALFPDLPVELDRRALAAACVAGARVTEADWPAALATVRASLADAPELQAWFDAELAATPYRVVPPVQLRAARAGFADGALHLDAAAFGVADVAGAADLCERVLGYRRNGLKLRPEAVENGASLSELQEKEAAVQRLSAACDALREHLGEKDAALWVSIRERQAQQQAHERERVEQQTRIADLTARLTAVENQGVKTLLRRAAGAWRRACWAAAPLDPNEGAS